MNNNFSETKLKKWTRIYEIATDTFGFYIISVIVESVDQDSRYKREIESINLTNIHNWENALKHLSDIKDKIHHTIPDCIISITGPANSTDQIPLLEVKHPKDYEISNNLNLKFPFSDWEYVKWNDVFQFYMHRMKVPGGWLIYLVEALTQRSTSANPISYFLSDPSHSWELPKNEITKTESVI